MEGKREREKERGRRGKKMVMGLRRVRRRTKPEQEDASTRLLGSAEGVFGSKIPRGTVRIYDYAKQGGGEKVCYSLLS